MPDRHQIIIGTGVVIVKDGKTLLAKRKRKTAEKSGAWGSMGGHVEFGESPTEAAIREAKEELGIEIGNLKFASCTNWILGDRNYIDISFTADIVSGEPRICEPDAIEEIGWFDLNNLPEPLFEPVKIVLESIKTGKAYYEIKE